MNGSDPYGSASPVPELLPTDAAGQYADLRGQGLPAELVAVVADGARASAAGLALALTGDAGAATQTVDVPELRGAPLVMLGMAVTAVLDVLRDEPAILAVLAHRLRDQAALWALVGEQARAEAGASAQIADDAAGVSQADPDTAAD